MRCKVGFLILLAAIWGFALAEEPWRWSSHNRRERAYHVEEEDIDDTSSQRDKLYSRSEREREPTTRRPTPGNPQNDEIDDYPDSAHMNDGTRNYPYAPNAYNGGQFGGFNNFGGGGFGNNGANGVLVGPGGPTGVIGRPQQYYPGGAGAGYPQGAAGQFPGQGGFPAQAGLGGIPGQAGGFGNGNGFPGAFPGQGQPQEGGLNPAFGGQYPQGAQFPGAQFPGGQFPTGQFGGGQFPATAQYPGAQFAGGQYPTGAGANPYVGAQYPGSGPQYTEGYGLAYTNGYPPNNGFNPYGGFPGYAGYATGFDDYDSTKRKLKVEGKSAAVESRKLPEKKVDDKVGKNFSKS